MALVTRLTSRATVRTTDAARSLAGASNAAAFTRILLAGHSTDSDRLLLRLLDHAKSKVPYWQASPLAAPGVDLLEAFRRLPILNKSDLRSAGETLMASNVEAGECRTTFSGGSTGEPVGVLHDRAYRDWSEATQRWYFREHLKCYKDDPTIILWGSERDILGIRGSRARNLYFRLTGTRLVNTFGWDENAMVDCLRLMERLRPTYIRGYASALYALSLTLLERGGCQYTPKFLYSAAETLTPDMRQTIETAFRSPVYDFYGSREVGPIAGEIRGGGLLPFRQFNLLEVVNDDGSPTPPGSSGSVIITNLRNYAMPIIRYSIGDTASVAERDHHGRVSLLSRIDGRSTDQFLALNGTKVDGRYFSKMFYGYSEVLRFQVTQEVDRSITIRLVLSQTASEAMHEDIERKVKLALGDVAVSWREVDDIPLTPQGKRLYTISHAAAATHSSSE